MSSVALTAPLFDTSDKFAHLHTAACGCQIFTSIANNGNGSDPIIYSGPDIAADTSTDVSISVGDSFISELEFVGDRDWIAIDLAAGDNLTFSLSGSGGNALSDPYLRLYNANGVLVAENDDGGSGLNSLLRFVVDNGGTYYIEAASWDNRYIGEYTVSVYETPPLEEFTYDLIADQLISGYWDGRSRSFDVTSGRVTYDISGLPAAAQSVALEALALWTDVTGIVFVSVTGGGQLRFQDTDEGAYASSTRNGSTIVYSTINVEASWLDQYGGDYNQYAFQTYVHEIGHALGLGHAGNYNGNASYGLDASYLNDSWATSVMSYFDQSENYFFSDQGFTRAAVATPMIADIAAMQQLYGLSTTTRTGDTVYGFNSTSNRTFHDATAYPGVAFTIVDSGGNDTLDYSFFSGDQFLTLRTEEFMNVNGRTGTVSIGRNTVIENAIGGGGNDQIFGNHVANLLRGNAGDDVIDGARGDDTIDGGWDNDRLFGSSGNDTLYGDSGDDILVGGSGYDWLYGGVGRDELRGEGGNDFLDGGGGNDTLFGGERDDKLYGNSGDDIIHGDDGNDLLDGSFGYDSLYGGRGEDVLRGGNGKDFLDGGRDDDTLRGGGREDKLFGHTGNDLLFGDEGDDRLDGSFGYDDLFGGSGNDFLNGGGGNDLLSGGSGNDILYGEGGIDSFFFGELGVANADRIRDFRSSDDVILLDSDAFSALSLGVLTQDAFYMGIEATTAEHRIIYNGVTGEIFYDADGNGAQEMVLFATVAPGTFMRADDFEVVDTGSTITARGGLLSDLTAQAEFIA